MGILYPPVMLEISQQIGPIAVQTQVVEPLKLVRFYKFANWKGGDEELARGSVSKRGKSWYAVYRVGGKQKWEKAGSSKRSAEALIARRMDEINRGGFREVKRIRFKEFASLWMRDYAAVAVKPSTLATYAAVIELHLSPYFGESWLHQIDPIDVQRFVSEKIRDEKLAPKTALNFLVLLREIFKHGALWGYCRTNPTEQVQRPRVIQQEMDVLSTKELQRFLENVTPKYYSLFLVAVLTGVRRGELLALKWGDVDWNSSQICVRRSLYKGTFVTPKTKYSNRRIVMTPLLQRKLLQHRLSSQSSDSDIMFTNNSGLPLDPDNLIKREFYPALERAGLRRIRFHDLRHTYASLLIAQGENIKFIQSQLGHASATTTLDRYGHLMPNFQTNVGQRLDQTVFGNSVRKLLEIPVSEGNPTKNKTPEVIELQEFKLGSGGPQLRQVEHVVPNFELFIAAA